MRLSDAVEGFHIDRLGSGYSSRTVQPYMGNLGVLIDFLDDKDVAQVTSKDLKKFLGKVLLSNICYFNTQQFMLFFLEKIIFPITFEYKVNETTVTL